MRFHTYLEEIFGSEIKVKLLRVLCKFPRKGFGIREMATLIQVNHRSVSKSILELERHNLIIKQIFGRSHALYLNTNSYLYEPLNKLFRQEQMTLQKVIDLIKKHLSFQDIKVCAIFGSVAEEKEGYNSDIDLLIITTNKKKVEQKLEPLLVKVLDLFGNPLSPLLFTPAEFAATNPALRENIIKKNILICGKW
ncbi:TPA: nucleotidyltransferase domain-containing protein [Candidatus Woesearchaeota archaeon]|nr:nucleotidyltransferase domain-containing protein [Candidatus Woesearchaeota archaeon]